MTAMFPEPFWLVSLLVKASALLAVAALAHMVLRNRASAATRHWVWTLSVVALLAMPALSVWMPEWSVEVPVRSAPNAASTGPETPDSNAASAPQDRTAEAVPHVPPARAAEAAPHVPAAASYLPDVSLGPLALGIYLLGVVLLLTRIVVQQVSARRIFAAAERVDDGQWRHLLEDCADRLEIDDRVRLYRSREQTMPMAFGLTRPAILIPDSAAEWSADRREAVLLHELAHVGRHDCLTQLLASVACALYWPHPAIWWAAKRLRVERELACDDRVIAAGTEPRDYAGHLLDIAYTLGAGRSPALAVSMARRGQLEGRMLAVLDAARNRAIPGIRARATGAIAATALLVPLSAIVTTAVPVDYEADTLTIVDAPTESSAAVIAKDAKPPKDAKVANENGALTNDAQESAPSGAGSWTIRASDKKPGYVYLEMREERSNSGTTVPVSALEGLSAAQLSGAEGPVRFALRRDAGTFTFDGHVRGGVGGGTYSYAPNQAFGGELSKRGVGRPTDKEQYEMAKHDIGLAFVDELKSQGYPTPTTELLVKAGHHGARLEYLREMGQMGYKVGTLEALIKMRDHGVSPDYVKGMNALGQKLTADQLVNARDHGVTPEFASELAALGYGSMPVEGLIRVRDHGVTPDFVKALSAAGYSKLSIDELVNTRDHGVNPEYIKAMADAGYNKLALAELVNARDHGVTPDYISGMKSLGFGSLALKQVVTARDHGVTPEYIKGLKDLGYQGMSLEEIIKLRDHGVTPDKVKRANERAGTKLPIDMIRQMADGGGLR